MLAAGAGAQTAAPATAAAAAVPAEPTASTAPAAAAAAAAPPATPAPAEPAAYVDRVLDNSPQQAPAEEPSSASTGWARGFSAEAQATDQKSSGVTTRSQSLLLSGFVETPDYGTISVNGTLVRNAVPVYGYGVTGGNGLPGTVVPFSYQSGSTFRIDQRAMPFDCGWFGNNSAGNISIVNPPMARGVGQVFLPSLPIDGASFSLEQPGRTSFNVSAGRLGYFDGISYQSFSASQGTAASAGAQTQLGGGDGPLGINRTDAAVQLIDARNYNANGVAGYAQDTRSIWTAASWQGLAPWADSLGSGFGGISDKVGGMRVQANLVESQGEPANAESLAPSDSAHGAWVDASWRSELMQQSASVYSFDPNLRWGSENLPSDLRGANWHGDISTRQWQLGGNVELSDSVSGLTGSSLYGNLFGRWRFDSRDAVSSTVAARTGQYAAQSVEATWEHNSDWGYTQWRADVANGVDLHVVRMGVDHSWKVAETQTLSTSLGFEQSQQYGYDWRSVLWGVIGTTPLPGGARLDLSMRGSNGLGSNPNSFLSANARVSWPLGRGWSLIAQYTESHGQELQNPAIVSALTAAQQLAQLVTPNSRSVMIALRYEERSGLARAPIGGRPGEGAGRLEGHVFFDQNGNGRREANEGGVAGATVILDGRFVALTDAQGFYSFPAVAAGTHRLELVQDNLPLPWSSPGSPQRQVELGVRSTTVADFPIQR